MKQNLSRTPNVHREMEISGASGTLSENSLETVDCTVIIGRKAGTSAKKIKIFYGVI